MYCPNCRGDIPLGVRFCNNCGAPVLSPRDDEATRIAGQGSAGLDPETTRYASHSPFDERQSPPARVEQLARREGQQQQVGVRAQFGGAPPGAEVARRAEPERRGADEEGERVLFTVRPTFLFIGLGYALAALGAVGLIVLLAIFTDFPALYSLLATLPLLLIPAFRHLKRNSVRYTLTDSKIEIDQGFVSRRTRNIPLRNIQDVTVSTNIPQRLLGFGNLLIDNANEIGGSTVMRNIPDPRRHADLLLRELRRWH
jgi:membrane protein YdbS with pleckstrin-like domain